MNWFDNYDFGQWAMVKYPHMNRVPKTPGNITEYQRDKQAGLWPARDQETIERLRQVKS
jgi:hypothetical protein